MGTGCWGNQFFFSFYHQTAIFASSRNFCKFPQFYCIKLHKNPTYSIAFFKKTCHIIKDFCPQQSQKNSVFFWKDCFTDTADVAVLWPSLLSEHFVVPNDRSDLYHEICMTAVCYSYCWTHFMTSLVVSYWQPFCVCRGDFKEKADINLNHEHCYCTVRSRWVLVYLFHVLRWRARVCACVCVLQTQHKEKMTNQDTTPPSIATTSASPVRQSHYTQRAERSS